MATGAHEPARTTVHLALGSNRGDRAAHLRGALAGIAALIEIDALSPVYETAPFGVLDQPDFWNMTVTGRTALPPEPLLDALKRLEQRLGRVASYRMGPREIDIDLLLYGRVVLDSPRLTLPHPGLRDRPFVLRPLLDVVPDLRHPVTGEPLADRLRELGTAGLRPLGAADEVLQRGVIR